MCSILSRSPRVYATHLAFKSEFVEPSSLRGVNLANRSCVTLSDLCSVQCFRQCTLILKRPIFKALSVSRYRQKAPGQQHMVSSSTSSGHVCMNSERERQPFIDYAYMAKEKLFSWHKLEFLENTYIVKGYFSSNAIKSMAILSLKSKEERVRAARKSRKGLQAAELWENVHVRHVGQGPKQTS